MTDKVEVNIAGKTLGEWRVFARRDDCLERMVPSDLRQIIGALASTDPLMGEDRNEALNRIAEAYVTDNSVEAFLTALHAAYDAGHAAALLAKIEEPKG